MPVHVVLSEARPDVVTPFQVLKQLLLDDGTDSENFDLDGSLKNPDATTFPSGLGVLSTAHKDLVLQLSWYNLKIVAVVDAIKTTFFLVADLLAEDLLHRAR